MQVSHVETANTHAIMGGGKARSFSMSQSAEFFTVLSDTLYRDKKRAVVREVVCNAWDAHIMVGKTDVPVEITLTDEELIIQDFGPGIADDRMDDVYIQYGGSTKVKDETQTGGFGLGSKAPFAYSDHFSVTSCHKGIKTVYAISRGGAETKGVPDMRVMVSVPDDKSGLTVAIPIRDVEDRHAFEEIITSVASQGGMKVNLNGKLQPAIDYTEARQSGFMVMNDKQEYDLHESTLYVLYGTVLYPVTSTEKAIIELKANLDRLVHPGFRTILVAPPNSIGVTPSREALSYTDMTIKTIEDLYTRMARRVRNHARQARKMIFEDLVNSLTEEGRYHLHKYENPTRYSGYFDKVEKIPLSSNALGVAKMCAFEAIFGMQSTIVTKLIGRAAAKRWRDDRRGLRRAFAYGHKETNHSPASNFFDTELKRKNTKLILRAALRSDTLKNLYVVQGFGTSEMVARNFNKARIYGKPDKQIVIAQSRAEAVNYLKDRVNGAVSGFPLSSEWTVFCASIPRSKKNLRAALKLEAEKLGFDVHEVKAALPKKPKIEKPKDKFLSLREFDIYDLGFQALPDLEEPEYYINLDCKITELRGTSWFSSFQNRISKIYRDRGVKDIAVVRGDAQVRRVEATGAKDAVLEIFKEVERKAKTREVLIAELLRRKTAFIGHKNYSGATWVAGDIIEACPETFFEFTPVRVANKSAVVERSALLQCLFNYARNARPKDHSLDSKFFEDLERQALDCLGDDILKADAFNHRFEGLNLLNTYRLSAEDTVQAVQIIRAIKNTSPMPEVA